MFKHTNICTYFQDGFLGSKFPLQVLLHSPSESQTMSAFKNMLNFGASNPLTFNPLALNHLASFLSENQVGHSNAHNESENSNIEDQQSNESELETCKLEEPIHEMDDVEDCKIKMEQSNNNNNSATGSPEGTGNSYDLNGMEANIPGWLDDTYAKLNAKQMELEKRATELSDKAKDLKEREIKVKEMEDRLRGHRLDVEERYDRMRMERIEWENRQDRERREWEDRQDRIRREWEERQDRIRREWEGRQDRLCRDKCSLLPTASTSNSVENGPL